MPRASRILVRGSPGTADNTIRRRIDGNEKNAKGGKGMTRAAMDALYSELKAGEMEFEECDVKQSQIGDLICMGILRKKDLTGFQLREIGDAVTIAERKDMRLIFMKGVHFIRKPGDAANKTTRIQNNELVFSIVEKNLLRTIEKERKRVLDSLSKKFAYIQEEEVLVQYEEQLKSLGNALSVFEARAGNVCALADCSLSLREYLQDACSELSKESVLAYMGDVVSRKRMNALLHGVRCLTLSC